MLHLPAPVMDLGTKNRAQLISGLYDADGCLKTRKTASGIYPRLSLAQKTRGIVEDVKETLLNDFGIASTMYQNDYVDVRVAKVERRWFLDINGLPNLQRYMASIGSRHPTIGHKTSSFIR